MPPTAAKVMVREPAFTDLYFPLSALVAVTTHVADPLADNAPLGALIEHLAR
jgi:hypothetical protein